MQDEIAASVAATLRARLREVGGGEGTPPAEVVAPTRRVRKTVDGEVYEAYLKGKYALGRRPDGIPAAIAHFERALSLDADFAPAHAGLGECYLWLGLFAVPPAAAFVKVRHHTDRALALDPEHVDAHWLRAEAAHWHDWDTEATARGIEHVLAREPHHPGALMLQAHRLNALERHDEALEAAAAAVRADPLGLGTRVWYFAMIYNAHQYDRLVEESTRLIAEHPTYGEGYRWRAMAQTYRGALPEARADLYAAREHGSGHVWTDVQLAVIDALEGVSDRVRARRDELMQRSATSWIPPIAMGQLEQMLGDYDAAFGWYERAYQMRDVLMIVFHTDPNYRLVPPHCSTSIADDPRWEELVRRVGVAPR